MELYKKIAKNGPILTKTYGDHLNKVKVKSHVQSLVPALKVARLVKTFSSPAEFLETDICGDHMLKASRGSGLCYDLAGPKRLPEIRLLLESWIKSLLRIGQPPEFLIEKKINDAVYGKTGSAVDYKFFCFHGVPHFFLMRHNGNRNFYYTDWSPLKLDKGPKLPEIDLSPMLATAATLSAPFPFVRIDLYNGADGIYFGEYTFHVRAGAREFTDELELKFGALWPRPVEP
jgi:hypothetical protein